MLYDGWMVGLSIPMHGAFDCAFTFETPDFIRDFKPMGRRTGRRLLAVGRHLLAVGRRLLAVGRRLLAAGRHLLAAGRRLLAVGRRLLAAGRRLLAAGRQPLCCAVPVLRTSSLPF